MSYTARTNSDSCMRRGCHRRKANGKQACSSTCRHVADRYNEAVNLSAAFPSEVTDKYMKQVSDLNKLVTQVSETRRELRKLWHEAGLTDEFWDQVATGHWTPESLLQAEAG